jgi:hypothetical protein
MMRSGGKFGDDLIEDDEPTPPDETVAQNLVWVAVLWLILHCRRVADQVDDPAQHLVIVEPRPAVWQRKCGAIQTI